MSKTDISVFSSNTEKGNEEWSLSKSLAEFVALIDDLVVVLDKTGKLIYCSDSVNKVLGYEFKDINGYDWWGIVFKNEVVAQNARTHFVSSFDVRDHLFERKMRSKKGELKWILWKYVRDKNDNVICIGKDITIKKKLEYDLRYYRKKLSTKYKELDNFVYKASHDLKGPVASIMGITNIAKEHVKNNAVKHYFNLIAKSSSRLNSILMDLMKISQISQEEPQLVPCGLDDLLNQIIENIKKESCENFEIKYTLQGNGVFYSDANMLSAILFNLIDNGVKFKKHISNSYVKVVIKHDDKGLDVLVSDNGVGIPAKVKHRVFEMFFRGHEYSEGTGLGLHIVKTAVDKLKGHINIIETSKKGTAVSIFLPNLIK